MLKSDMRNKLLRIPGVGVKVTDPFTMEEFYFFYEDFPDSKGEERAKKCFRHGEILQFYSSSWAKKTQFSLYMKRYHQMIMEQKKNPERIQNAKLTSYENFLAELLSMWTGCSLRRARFHILSNHVPYFSF